MAAGLDSRLDAEGIVQEHRIKMLDPHGDVLK